MRTTLIRILAALSLAASAHLALAQTTAFTYQGRLESGGVPVTGSSDLTFTLYTAASGGSTVGTSNVMDDLVMTNGLFTVTLDFGASPFLGSDRWLQIAVRPGASTGAYTNLLPRQRITATPYALFAAGANASTLIGSIPSTSLAGTYSVAVTLNNAGNVFAGNGSNLTALNASQLTSGTVPSAALGNAWTTGGNAGANPTNGAFIGTSDNQPLELKVNNQRSLRLEYGTSLYNGPGINVLGGSSRNYVSNGVIGATISGGGTLLGGSNQVLADFGTVAGGSQNSAGGVYATVGGGNLNTASGTASVIGGGQVNTVAGLRATVGGGAFNYAPGDYATIPGGSDNNASGVHSFAAGQRAKALHNGAFVWADSTAADFASTANNQFNVRASGGARFVTSGAGLSVDGPVAASFVGNGAGITNMNIATLQQSLGLVTAWGHGGGSTGVPSGLNDAVAVAGGFWFSMALRRDGTVVVWGSDADVEHNIPAGLNHVVAIGAGFGHCLAVKSDGTVVAWGKNNGGQANVPAGLSNVIAVAGADEFSLALKRDGTVVGWGNVTVPPGLSNIMAISASAQHSLVLQSNGTVLAWGSDDYGQSTVPAGLTNVVGIAAGSWHSLALHNNGTVTGWGRNDEGQRSTYITDAVAISAGHIFSLALLRDGTVYRWGFPYYGELVVPAGLNNVVAISASGHHACVIESVVAPAQLALLDSNNTLQGSVNAADLVGTISSAQLPGDVALRTGGNAFTGQQTVTSGNVGIGTSNPMASIGYPGGWEGLHIQNPTGNGLEIIQGTNSARLHLRADSNATDNQDFAIANGANKVDFMWLNAGLGLRLNAMSIAANGNLTVAGTVTANGVLLTSDRNAKENFAPVSPAAMLEKVAALPITEWNYKNGGADVRHIGPMAQDFQDTFGLNGGDEQHISVVDASGVALAAIQGLNRKLEGKVTELCSENAALKKRLDRLEKLLGNAVEK